MFATGTFASRQQLLGRLFPRRLVPHYINNCRFVVLSSEELVLLEKEGLTLTEAAKILPGRIPSKRICTNTLWRWCMKGLNNGIRLKSVLVGGQRLTTRRWLQEFIEARTAEGEPEGRIMPRIRTPAQRQRDSERATKELEALWNSKKQRSAK